MARSIPAGWDLNISTRTLSLHCNIRMRPIGSKTNTRRGRIPSKNYRPGHVLTNKPWKNRDFRGCNRRHRRGCHNRLSTPTAMSGATIPVPAAAARNSRNAACSPWRLENVAFSSDQENDSRASPPTNGARNPLSSCSNKPAISSLHHVGQEVGNETVRGCEPICEFASEHMAVVLRKFFSTLTLSATTAWPLFS